MSLCAYCQDEPASNSEHVFPAGLGCGPYYLDCVCDECNNFFSGLETELMLRTPINLPRASKGLSGGDLVSRRHVLQGGFHLQPETTTGMVFEVITTLAPGGSRPFMRPQLLAWNASYLAIASTTDEWKIFEEAISSWFRNGLTVVTSPPSRRGDPYEGFSSKDKGTTWEKTTWLRCPKVFLRVIDNGTFKGSITPRLFPDDQGRLHCRAKDESALLDFLADVCPRIVAGEPFDSTAMPQNPNFGMVQISYKMKIDKVLRAAAKIMVNGLFHLYPTVRTESWIKLWSDYILLGKGELVGWSESAPEIDGVPDYHQLLFSFSGDQTISRLVLFNHVAYTASFPRIERPAKEELALIAVNYQTGVLEVLRDAEYVRWISAAHSVTT